MCGICGVIWWNQEPVEDAAIEAMRDRMTARGPDQCGLWRGRWGALAHRRLAILDLSESGRQPLANENETVWITYNGEIYNYRELTAELTGLGHRFRSRTDTEVLVHGYEEWGIEGLCRRLRGMFAFGLWDEHRRQLYVARDRFGEKPLFWARCAGRVLFASSPNALIPLLPERKPDPEALVAFLHLGWIPSELCALRGVRKVLPAQFVTITERAETASSYWRLSYNPRYGRTADQWMEEIDATLSDAVRGQLQSDVPLGGFLSGGVDSSYVVALGAQHQPGLRSFSMKPDEPEYDESRYAQAVARHLGTDHHQLELDRSALGCLDDLLAEFGEPFADSSAIPCYLLSKLTRRHVTVALTGDGGDEVFAGYHDISRLRRFERWRRGVPQPIRSGALAALAWTAGRTLPGTPIARRARTLAAILGGDARSILRGRSMIASELRDSLWGPELREAAATDPHYRILTAHWDNADADDDIARLLFVDLTVQLPGDFLVKVDVASMACSLETRCPFLDHRAVELAATIPADQLFLKGESKGLLKACAARRVPPDAVYRPKWGFSVPIFQWLSPNTAQQSFQESLAVSLGLIQPKALSTILAGYATARRRYAKVVYTLWVLETWLRRIAGLTSTARASALNVKCLN